MRDRGTAHYPRRSIGMTDFMLRIGCATLALAACAPEAEAPPEPDVAENQAAIAEPAQPASEPNALQPVDNAAQPTQPAGGGSGEESMAWNFSRSAAGPKLAYGEPQTDNVRLMLRCAGNDVILSFIRPAEIADERPDTLAILSGGARRSLTIETAPGQLGTSVEAEAPLDSAPLERFRSGSDLEVRWGSETISVPGSPQGPLRQFFEACG